MPKKKPPEVITDKIFQEVMEGLEIFHLSNPSEIVYTNIHCTPTKLEVTNYAADPNSGLIVPSEYVTTLYEMLEEKPEEESTNKTAVEAQKEKLAVKSLPLTPQKKKKKRGSKKLTKDEIWAVEEYLRATEKEKNRPKDRWDYIMEELDGE